MDLDQPVSGGDRADHRKIAVQANGQAWELLSRTDLDGPALDDLLERAYASSYHWRRATEPGAPERARAAWLLARCHTVAGHIELALHHADQCEALTATAEMADFDLAYAHEAVARANALAGRLEEAARQRELAGAVAIDDPEDRAMVEADVAAGPWFGLETQPET